MTVMMFLLFQSSARRRWRAETDRMWPCWHDRCGHAPYWFCVFIFLSFILLRSQVAIPLPRPWSIKPNRDWTLERMLLLFRQRSTKSVSSAHWMDTSWHVQVSSSNDLLCIHWLTYFYLDKWSKPLDDAKIINDPALLPSVLWCSSVLPSLDSIGIRVNPRFLCNTRTSKQCVFIIITALLE